MRLCAPLTISIPHSRDLAALESAERIEDLAHRMDVSIFWNHRRPLDLEVHTMARWICLMLGARYREGIENLAIIQPGSDFKNNEIGIWIRKGIRKAAKFLPVPTR